MFLTRCVPAECMRPSERGFGLHSLSRAVRDAPLCIAGPADPGTVSRIQAIVSRENHVSRAGPYGLLQRRYLPLDDSRLVQSEALTCEGLPRPVQVSLRFLRRVILFSFH